MSPPEYIPEPEPEAKAIASRVPRHLHDDWHTLKLNVMKIVLLAKADNYEPFRTTLLESVGRRLVRSTKDVFWACGLSLDNRGYPYI